MKPPFRVPSMREIESIPSTFTHVSTFSGCGGSCLGFRMAGARTIWASEFIEAARDTYKANHPGVPLDGRDIREVKAQEILDAIGLKAGELDVLEGSPPCSSFSTAGNREKGWGSVKAYSDGAQRTDDLFFEFTRLLRGIQPRAFVAENVSGLVKGKAKGYFLLILAELKSCGFKVRAKVLDAQWLGVPQARQRLIFVGVREDLGFEPPFPEPLPYRYSIRDALPWIRSASSKGHGFFEGGEMPIDRPVPTVSTHAAAAAYSGHMVEAFPPGHAEDAAAADISRFAIGREWEKLKPGQTSDRYFNLVRPRQDAPCPTVTQTAGGLGAAGVTHPFERRKFTIPELRRLCGFPDDFVLLGTYAQQWERLGRAVPPVMMAHVAEAIREHVILPLRGPHE